MSHINDTVSIIISEYKAGKMNQINFVIEISHAVGMSGKTSFNTAWNYAMHLLNQEGKMVYIIYTGAFPDVKVVKVFTNEKDAIDFVRPNINMGLAKCNSVNEFLDGGCHA